MRITIALTALLTLVTTGLWVSSRRAERPTVPRATSVVQVDFEHQLAECERLREGIAADGVGKQNGAVFYLQALNAYQSRRDRAALMRDIDPSPYRSEPKISMSELTYLMYGADQLSTDFFAPAVAGHPLVFRGGSGREPFNFSIATDPYETRPYIQPLRLLALVALKESMRRHAAGRAPEAERIQLAVLKLGSALTVHPGALLDLGLGIEIQRLALSYMEDIPSAKTQRIPKQRLAAFKTALHTLQEAVGDKYASLDSMTRAKEIAERDKSPIWRIAAVFAAGIRCATDRLDRGDVALARSIVETSLRDPVPAVRRAGMHMRKALLDEEKESGIRRKPASR